MAASIDAIDLAAKLAGGDADAAVQAWLRQGFAIWLRSDSTLPLERCLRLPTTQARMRIMRRNYWLAQAALLLDAASSWQLALKIEEELNTFLSRGPWRVWCENSEPPAEASQLRTALFHFARSSNGRSMSAKQIHRVIGTTIRPVMSVLRS